MDAGWSRACILGQMMGEQGDGREGGWSVPLQLAGPVTLWSLLFVTSVVYILSLSSLLFSPSCL